MPLKQKCPILENTYTNCGKYCILFDIKEEGTVKTIHVLMGLRCEKLNRILHGKINF